MKVYKKPTGKTWEELYSNSADKEATKLRIEEVESYYGTLGPLQDTDRNELQINTVLNGNSQLIYVKPNINQNFLYSSHAPKSH